ncbi:MAG: hypothetical protein IJL76_02430 [Bacilli bacterium]|nr:hypothetical protein [Bacilli bacterium]
MRKTKKELNYPVLECIEASIGTGEIIELGLGLVFMFFGFISPVICFLNASNNIGKVSTGLLEIFAIMLIFFSVFGIIGLIFFIDFLKPVIRMIILKYKGVEKTAIVFGYTSDNRYIDDKPTRIVKLLIEDEQKLVYYQLGHFRRPYKRNSKVILRTYKNMFRIINKNK